ncbi:lysylphosphatidylglycerol synthase transmembrane domain-containing protein [Bosea sp. BK604]|uniref:lysylphosphatidylglycerol synthase transmembrane domain-containing protein n=1 Tax=Bosea sp. BK604 TaxID=2512180 RepID=UPI0010460564|nr:lysylphosphatidylglycerol synthase transmembrane domain-containing protein [Bosea sp. BK604]TCR69994.1 uncharacterized membrane protein YbhN (UPF0104 family) [Bosea sp. BK604]
MIIRYARHLWPYVLAALCCGVALYAFDWRAVGSVIGRADWAALGLSAVPILLIIFGLGTVRWLAVTGQPVRFANVVDIYLYIAVVIAVASQTPMQLGESLKIKFARRSHVTFTTSTMGFLLERIVDLVMVFWLAALGLAWRGDFGALAGIAAGCALLGTFALPALLRFIAWRFADTRIGNLLRALSKDALPPSRFAVLIACTAGKWLLVAALWRAAIQSVGIGIDFPTSMCLVSVVTVVATLSMVPGGLGVSELSIRALLISFGKEPFQAEAAAIAVRLLTPVMIGLGLIHLPILMLLRRIQPAPNAADSKAGQASGQAQPAGAKIT